MNAKTENRTFSIEREIQTNRLNYLSAIWILKSCMQCGNKIAIRNLLVESVLKS